MLKSDTVTQERQREDECEYEYEYEYETTVIRLLNAISRQIELYQLTMIYVAGLLTAMVTLLAAGRF